MTKAEKKEMEEYEKIIAFHNLVILGKHPTIKPTPEQVSHVSHTIVSDSSMDVTRTCWTDMLRCRLLELVVSQKLSELLQ